MSLGVAFDQLVFGQAAVRFSDFGPMGFEKSLAQMGADLALPAVLVKAGR